MKNRLFLVVMMLLLVGAASASAAEYKIKMKYPAGTAYRYDYTQDTTPVTKVGHGQDGEVSSISIHNIGDMSIECDNGGGNMVVNITSSSVSVNGMEPEKKSGQEVKTQKMFINERGMVFKQDADGGHSPNGDLFFPVPTKKLNSKKKLVENVTLPFNSMSIKARVEYQFVKEEVVDGVRCIYYKANVKAKLPAEMKIKGSVDCDYDCCFAVDDGYFVLSDCSLNMVVEPPKGKGNANEPNAKMAVSTSLTLTGVELPQ